MMEYAGDRRVILSRLHEYDPDKLYEVMKAQLASLCVGPETLRGKKVVIKPNLVSKRDPMQAATTHPEVMRAVLRILREWGIPALIAESPSGPYTKHALEQAYRASGFYDLAIAEGAVFNEDLSFGEMTFPEGDVCRSFHVIKPVLEADVVISLCKLKTHGLTKMTAAVKNLFGIVPGTEKVEMHSRFSDSSDFCGMLVDLCRMVCGQKELITFCDGILSMEGEGPGTGDPRYLDVLLAGRNPFALDLAASEVIGFGGTVPMVERAKKLGLCPERAEDLEVIGTPIAEVSVSDFKEPDAHRLARIFGMIPGFVRPRPVIDRKVCRGCGVCVRSCPRQTISIQDRKALINRKNCIRCFCCQELCPYKAVKVKRSVVFTKILR